MKVDLSPQLEWLLEHAPMSWSARLAAKLAYQHDLAYRTRVNLHHTIDTLIQHGLSKKKVRNLIGDLFDNIYFINNPPMLPMPAPTKKPLRKI